MANSLAGWWDWCLLVGADPSACDARDLARFVTQLQSVPKGMPLSTPVRSLPGDPRRRRDSTIALRCAHIKSYYAWALANGRIPVATGRSIRAFKPPRMRSKRTADRLSPDQARLLLSQPFHARDRLALELLYGLGLRRGEAAGVRIQDMCTSREVSTVYGCAVPGGPHVHVRRRLNPNGALAKSPDSRVVPITPRVMVAYRDWAAWCYDNEPHFVDCAFLLVSLAGPTRGGPLTVSALDSRWRARMKSIPGLEFVTPHLMRHTFASELIDAGVPPATVQHLLGHRSPQSTQIYTHALMSTLGAAVERLGDWRQANLGGTW